MTYLRKAKHTASHTIHCGLCRLTEPPSKPAHCLPKTLSAGNPASAATVATNDSSLRAHASQLLAMAIEREVCPVTGVYENVADDYYVSPNVLGKGNYGVVRECVHRATRQSFAVKSIDKSKVRRLDHLQREIFLLANFDHHGIVNMVDCYEDADFVHIVTEKYTGGELYDRILKSYGSHGCFSERRAGAVVKSLLEALSYLHERGVVHRDIKPENVLFESREDDSPVRLVDFGLSRRHARGDRPMTNPVGTAYYMSPELLAGRYDHSTDLWSVGVVAYILLCGFPPFRGATDAEVHEATRRNRLSFRGSRWADKSDAAVDFVKCLLRKDPERRFTAREALAHPWIAAVENAVQGQGPNPGHQGPLQGQAAHPSFIFSNPTHGVPCNKNAPGGLKGGTASAVPMPAAYELNTKMARMA